jgi:cyclopropane-fatty-acyl-phospholipid synthase
MIDTLVAKGVLPDSLLKYGIKKLLKQRLNEEIQTNIEKADAKRKALINDLKSSPIAIETDAANDQHYQVPTEFFKYVLGKRMKYSCCHFDKSTNLDDAEVEMLDLTLDRAEIEDGHKILELGCGWGSVTLRMAERFPNSSITAVSNSKTQREYILNKAKEMGLTNVNVITANVAELEMNETFDRVISVEMFEHMRNYKKLLSNIDKWLNKNGKLFVHIFVHKDTPYYFDVKDDTDWMSKYFFSGGIMPSEHLMYYFQDDLLVENHWNVNGTHYGKTARGWLQNMDKNRVAIMKVFNKHYGKDEAKKWWNYWRVFFLACEGLWNYQGGNEWYVGHYLFKKKED